MVPGTFHMHRATHIQFRGLQVQLELLLILVHVAMAASDAEPLSPCPVVQAWGQSEIILKRLLDKDLLILHGSRLSRSTVLANRELVVPLLNLVGHLKAHG